MASYRPRRPYRRSKPRMRCGGRAAGAYPVPVGLPGHAGGCGGSGRQVSVPLSVGEEFSPGFEPDSGAGTWPTTTSWTPWPQPITASADPVALKTLPEHPTMDWHDLPMEMVYLADPHRHTREWDE